MKYYVLIFIYLYIYLCKYHTYGVILKVINHYYFTNVSLILLFILTDAIAFPEFPLQMQRDRLCVVYSTHLYFIMYLEDFSFLRQVKIGEWREQYTRN
jgi:hypothetical protein